MKNTAFITKILILILTLTLAFPELAFAVDEAYDESAPEAVPGVELEDGSTESPEELSEGPAEVLPEEEVTEDPDSDEDDPEEEMTDTVKEIGVLGGLTAEENPTGTVELTWEAFEGASYYESSSPQIEEEPVRAEECTQSFSGLDHGVTYEFVVAAYDADGQVVAQSAVSIDTVAYKVRFNEAAWRVLKKRTITPKKFNVNLTKKINEPNSGYAVVQGGCADGTYAYYLMVSSKTQKGRVLKVRIRDNKVIKRSKVLNTWHGNGMTYDSTRKKLVVIAREHRKQQLTVIDASTLKITKQKNVKYSYDIDAWTQSLSERYKQSGLAAIAYVKKYDCYICLERVHHNLLMFDPDTFECIGLAYTNIEDKYPGTFQGMDADSKYVYLLLSYYNKVQPYNIIVAIDWNSENLLPVANASKSRDLPYVPRAWWCGNDQNGKADAAIRIKTTHEAENIYHTTDKSGREHFYMAEYYGHKAYKKVGKRRTSYYKRDNYVYDLGII